ncbi:DUF6678 family protein [Carboxylicivirga sp. RSCT41]|uniref:DUF6678 family protein n=1 Tax=Carboxylicivirga agarovorans TaxID=3417570 RepID=UPI003D341B74
MNELEKINNRIDNAIKKFDSSFMSNSKWSKLIHALIDNEIDIAEFEIKYVRTNHIYKELGFCFEESYENNFTKFGLLDGGLTSGPANFKEIEWIEFKDNLVFCRRHNKKAELNYKKRIQYVDIIVDILNSLGSFEYEKNNYRLKIYGYK